MNTLSHRQRLETVLSGEQPDRTPIALWRHFPVDDQNPATLIEATWDFQQRYDFDLIKVTPPSSYCLKDWGIEDEWRGNPEGTRDYTRRVITTPDDWRKLKVLSPKEGHLANQVEVLRQVTQKAGSALPVLQTIFSPLAQAKNLVGGTELLAHIRSYPVAVHEGLKIITQSTLNFIDEIIPTGLAGIFYAVQHAQYTLLNEDEFSAFGVPYDMEILKAADKLWLNMAHLHGDHVMFDLVAKYPIHVLNWHDRDTSPSLGEALQKFNGVLCGGLSRQKTMVLGNPDTVKEETRDAILSTGGKRLIVGTGCVLPITVPRSNILAARDEVER